MAGSKVEEMGITVDDFFGNEPKMKVKQCNRKIKIFRESALATLCTLAKSKKGGKSSYVAACDALAASGITGLQWKKHLKTQVHVSLADHDDLSKLMSNANANSLDATEITLNSARIPGDPFQIQGEDEVHVYRADARALLSMEAFQFIYLNPHKNCPEFIESAFHSVSHGGVVCLVVSDASSFGRAPHIVRRQYAARVIKTEYWKEMAARIVLASMALAAARCNKGIIPQYVVSIEDYLLVCVKVGRGHVRSEAALNEIVQLLHCRFCEERVFMELQLAPEENPYSRLPCKCKQSHLGKTAVLIGPMWKGAIFNYEHLCELQQVGIDMKLSHSFNDLIKQLMAESFGNDDKKNSPTVGRSSTETNANEKDNGDSRPGAADVHMPPAIPEHGGNDPEQALLDAEQLLTGNPILELDAERLLAQDSTLEQEENMKRKSTEVHEDVDVKKIKKDADSGKEKKKLLCCQSSNVPFYYNVNKVKATNLPKLDKVISILQNAGYKASRTHFDPCAIRTTANVQQLLGILSR